MFETTNQIYIISKRTFKGNVSNIALFLVGADGRMARFGWDWDWFIHSCRML